MNQDYQHFYERKKKFLHNGIKQNYICIAHDHWGMAKDDVRPTTYFFLNRAVDPSPPNELNGS